MDRDKGNTPVVGQSFSKFMDYNDTVMTEVKKSYTSSYDQLSDPNELLAVKTLKSTCTDFGKEYTKVKYSLRDINNKKDSKMMNDKDRQNYLVKLFKIIMALKLSRNDYQGRTCQKDQQQGGPSLQ